MKNIYLFLLMLAHCALHGQDIKVLALEANDLTYLSTLDKLMITTSADVAHGNSLCMIDPYHGAIDTCIWIGDSPGIMAVSDDEQFVYIALLERSEVVRFDVGTKTITLRIPLENPVNPEVLLIAEDIAVLPGSPEVIAVALKNPEALPWQAGVVIYENEIRRDSVLLAPNGSNCIVFDTAGYLYGYRNETNTDLGLQKMYINEEGVFWQSTHIGLLERVYDEIKYADGNLYSNFGKLIRVSDNSFDPLAGFEVGNTFPVVEPLTDVDAVLFLNAEGAAITLQAFDKELFIKTDEQGYAHIKGNPYKLIHWGADENVAFLTRDYITGEESRVVIMRICTTTITEPPVLSWTGPACLGDTVTLLATDQQGPLFWSNGKSGPEIHLVKPEVLFCASADEAGCLGPASDTILISFTPYPETPYIFLSPDEQFVVSSLDYNFGMQWFLDGNPVPGADSVAIKVTTSGVYTMQVDWEGCLSPFSNEVSIVISGVEEIISHEAIRFYTNPVTDECYVRLQDGETRVDRIQLFSIEGNVLYTFELPEGQTECSISMAEFPAGIYYIHAISTQGKLVTTGSLVKL